MVSSGKSRAAASASAIPSMIGMRMSVSRRSKRPASRTSRSSASLPSHAVATSWPSLVSARAQSASSSSAMRMRAMASASAYRAYDVAPGNEAHEHVAGVRRRRSKPGAEGNGLARRQRRTRGNRGPRIDFLPRRIANDEFEPRHFDGLVRVVDDVALDQEDRYPLVLLRCGGDAIEAEAAQVHRQAHRRIKGSGLRQGAHEIAAPADEQSIDKEQRQDGGLQVRERPAPTSSPRASCLSPGGNRLDVPARLGLV